MGKTDDEGPRRENLDPHGFETDAGLLSREDLLAGYRLILPESEATDTVAHMLDVPPDLASLPFWWTEDTLILVSLTSAARRRRIQQHRGWTDAEVAEKQRGMRARHGMRPPEGE